MKKDTLEDINGVMHDSIEIKTDLIEDWGSIYDRGDTFTLRQGLKHYFIDGSEVSREKFYQLFPHHLKG